MLFIIIYYRKIVFFKAFVVYLFLKDAVFTRFFWLFLKKKSVVGGYSVVHHTHGICSEWMPSVGQFVFTCVRSLGKVFFAICMTKKKISDFKFFRFLFGSQICSIFNR